VTGTTQTQARQAMARRAARQDAARQDQARGDRTAIDPDRVFAALADPRRRELLELLGQTPGCSASSLAARLPVSRQAVAQHLSVLEDSSLVSRRRVGREVLFSVRSEGVSATADWLTGRAALWRERLEYLRQQAASDPHQGPHATRAPTLARERTEKILH
jgi:DNA-binding transcriptional ArsR family regulator